MNEIFRIGVVTFVWSLMIPMPHFEYTIRLGDVLMMFSILTAALFAWRDLSWRVKIVEASRNEDRKMYEDSQKEIRDDLESYRKDQKELQTARDLALQAWQTIHEGEARQRDAALSQIKENTSLLRQIAEEANRRLKMLEEENLFRNHRERALGVTGSSKI